MIPPTVLAAFCAQWGLDPGPAANDLLAALRASGTALEPDWQPMPSAPPSGRFIVWSARRGCALTAVWQWRDGRWRLWLPEVACELEPNEATHWRPALAGPTE